jgi:hypothetical protein
MYSMCCHSIDRYLSSFIKMCQLFYTTNQCQVLQLEVELETIERVVRRIEQANNDTSPHQPSGDPLLTMFQCLNRAIYHLCGGCGTHFLLNMQACC